MNGELAQAIALVAHGNATLADGEDPRALEESNSTFQYVRSLEMEVPRRLRGKTTTVDSVLDWVRALRRADVGRLSLIAGGSTPVAFANQGAWGILAHRRKQTLAWYPRWEVNNEGVDPQDPTPKIWEDTYGLSIHGQAMEAPISDVARRASGLRQAIDDARVFGQRFTASLPSTRG